MPAEDRPPTAAERAAAERRAREREAAFLRILQFGDPVLRSASEPVITFDAELAKLGEEMVELMDAANGAGLAAPQMGILRRLFVYRHGEGSPAQVVVNPRVVEASEATELALEGCLSLGKARVAVEVERPARVVVEAQTVTGDPVRLEAEGMHARVLQHETDHLDGVLMLQRTSREQRRDATRALREGRAYRPELPAQADEPEVDA